MFIDRAEVVHLQTGRPLDRPDPPLTDRMSSTLRPRQTGCPVDRPDRRLTGRRFSPFFVVGLRRAGGKGGDGKTEKKDKGERQLRTTQKRQRREPHRSKERIDRSLTLQEVRKFLVPVSCFCACEADSRVPQSLSGRLSAWSAEMDTQRRNKKIDKEDHVTQT